MHEVLLRFANGSSRSLRIPDPLAVVCRGMERISHQIGPPPGSQKTEQTDKLIPSKFDEIIELLGRAESVESVDNIVHLAHEASREALKLEAASLSSAITLRQQKESAD